MPKKKKAILETVETVGLEIGNTRDLKPTNRINPYMYWVFTLWDCPETFQSFISTHYRVKGFVYQRERVERGDHFQGLIKFDTKVRPMNIFTEYPTIHWEPCNNLDASIKYCQKKESRVAGPWFKNMPIIAEIKVLKFEQLVHWQKLVVKIIETEPDERKIYWFWEPDGNSGKSTFCKYLAVVHGATILTGKATDMKHSLSLMPNYPKIVVIDLPRSLAGYISYPGIEEIKNGCFFSGKYETKQVIGNPPHVLIFANNKPDEDQLSSDRWKILMLPPLGNPSPS